MTKLITKLYQQKKIYAVYFISIFIYINTIVNFFIRNKLLLMK